MTLLYWLGTPRKETVPLLRGVAERIEVVRRHGRMATATTHRLQLHQQPQHNSHPYQHPQLHIYDLNFQSQPERVEGPPQQIPSATSVTS